jgi:hypothetical protein
MALCARVFASFARSAITCDVASLPGKQRYSTTDEHRCSVCEERPLGLSGDRNSVQFAPDICVHLWLNMLAFLPAALGLGMGRPRATRSAGGAMSSRDGNKKGSNAKDANNAKGMHCESQRQTKMPGKLRRRVLIDQEAWFHSFPAGRPRGGFAMA